MKTEDCQDCRHLDTDADWCDLLHRPVADIHDCYYFSTKETKKAASK